MLMTVLCDYAFTGQIITLQPGDTMQLGERSNPDGPYPNWIYCTSDKTQQSGWVAAHIITVQDGIASVTQSYTSEEMTVSTGDVIDTIFELNGWYWARRISDQKEAWVDKLNLRPGENP